MTTHMTGLSGNIKPPKKAPGKRKSKLKVYVYQCECFVNYGWDKNGKCVMCGGERKGKK